MSDIVDIIDYAFNEAITAGRADIMHKCLDNGVKVTNESIKNFLYGRITSLRNKDMFHMIIDNAPDDLVFDEFLEYYVNVWDDSFYYVDILLKTNRYNKFNYKIFEKGTRSANNDLRELILRSFNLQFMVIQCIMNFNYDTLLILNQRIKIDPCQKAIYNIFSNIKLYPDPSKTIRVKKIAKLLIENNKVDRVQIMMLIPYIKFGVFDINNYIENVYKLVTIHQHTYIACIENVIVRCEKL